MNKRELVQRWNYIVERLPEIIMERQRLKNESLKLKTERVAAAPERKLPLQRRLSYVVTRSGELRDEQARLAKERKGVAADLKVLRKA